MTAPQPPRLLDLVREALRIRHRSRRTERAYVHWIKRYLAFHGMRHPQEMGVPEVRSYLTYLASTRRVSASTQNQAFSALLFLHRSVLEHDMNGLESTPRAVRRVRVPVILTREEVDRILRHIPGVFHLMASLLYGSGLRLLECARLRVKDVDFGRGELVVRDGKGRKDRRTILPTTLVEPLRTHLEKVRQLHEANLAAGTGTVALPDALERKYPKAANQWGWQWVFPAARTYRVADVAGHQETQKSAQ
jgi:integron integrase